jgi:serine/threonine protein phosphatase PrpC
MSTLPRAELFLEGQDELPTRVECGLGELVKFSKGGPGKAINEDGAAVIEHEGEGLIAVADGMGGMNAGDRASRTALETLVRRLTQEADPGAPLRHMVLDGFERANAAVLGLGVGAGTTLAATVLRGDTAQSLHVGDSMALQVGQRGRMKALTIPHSPTGYAVEAGWLDQDDALHHEERHLISNYVGLEGMRIELGAPIPIARRDTLLLASDGLADNLRLEEIIELVRKGPLLQAGRKLAELALRRMTSPEPNAPSKPDDLTFLLFRPGPSLAG